MSKLSDPRPLPAEASLPPVEPPSAGFLVQLFVIPLVIVAIIVGIYLMFSWLAHQGTDARRHVRQIERGGTGSWQAALDLTTELRGNEELRQDEELARQVQGLLEREIAKGELSEESVKLRSFLCWCVGEFNSAGSLPLLIKTIGEPGAVEVRLAAMQSTAVNIARLREKSPPPSDLDASIESASTALIAASQDDDREVQNVATYALGVTADPPALERLEVLVEIGSPDARYNAATGLAHAGRTSCIPVLVEMMSPNRLTPPNEKEKPRWEYKKWIIVENGLKAAARLAEVDNEADLRPLAVALEELQRQKDLTPPVRVEAETTRQAMEKRERRLSPVPAAD